MKMYVDYFDNVIELNESFIPVLEIENKDYFYSFIKNLISLENGDYVDKIKILDKNGHDNNHIFLKVILNYFNFEFNYKKINNSIIKIIINNIDELERIKLSRNYQRICDIFSKILDKIDISLKFNDEFDLESFLKFMKFEILSKNTLIENLFLLIDISKILEMDNFIVFVNLKQYLDKNELHELYKYSIYNNVKIMLVDSQSYGIKIDYEWKLLIDKNMDEFML